MGVQIDIPGVAVGGGGLMEDATGQLVLVVGDPVTGVTYWDPNTDTQIPAGSIAFPLTEPSGSSCTLTDAFGLVPICPD